MMRWSNLSECNYYVTLVFILNIMNELLDIKMKRIKIKTWHQIRLQLEDNLDWVLIIFILLL